ncbi:hypothetical protein BJ138DRAFT_726053 [Hygrophoropsis aurantiaca]|uniref:Uncharacterized protein n=1 Tax=Hygrophoropsis aurantiaca TaxID=72124 RepID=A0ACB8AIW9_9AGAM|nr:hypothetical protein BJ138DRAFT_726053 [Hygrophoropsis aurantiaca]
MVVLELTRFLAVISSVAMISADCSKAAWNDANGYKATFYDSPECGNKKSPHLESFSGEFHNVPWTEHHCYNLTRLNDKVKSFVFQGYHIILYQDANCHGAVLGHSEEGILKSGDWVVNTVHPKAQSISSFEVIDA